MKGKGIGHNEIARALRINSLIEKYGISDEALPAIQLLAEAAKKENIDPSVLGNLLSAATGLFTAERNGEGKGIGFYTPSDILKRIQELAETR